MGMERARVIDTFAARNLQAPPRKKEREGLSKYSIKAGHGLEVRRYRKNEKLINI